MKHEVSRKLAIGEGLMIDESYALQECLKSIEAGLGKERLGC